MTIRIPVSTLQNHWNDAQRVDRSDMNAEQLYNSQTNAAIVNNHLGSGVVPSAPIQAVLFDSEALTEEQASILAAGNFDGTGMAAHAQPSDSNLGNQLEVELTGTSAFGRLSTKVLVVGLDFQSNPQYDRFTFHKNEKQVTRKHYTRILGIFFIDFKGNNNCSINLGGSIVIREAASFELSRDPIMAAQDVEPNLFFRDFKIPDPNVTLYNTLQTGIGSEYSVDSLDINTTVRQNRSLAVSDVSSKIAQKFLATTNNIQKITLLLGAGRDDLAAIEDRFDWSGELVVSVYELQTTIECPTDIVPELAIEFDPKAQPLAQLSFSQEELRNLGYVLTDVLQPVDFVFSTTQLGSTTNSVIVPGRYYAVSINRAGAASSGSIFTGVGNDKVENARLSLFGSSVWVDVTEEDLWFQVWTDAAKVADGQAYDAGNPVEVLKTTIDDTGAEIDYSLDEQPFADTGENVLNIAIVQASLTESVQEQDERTGNPVFSRQKFEPSISFVTSSGLEDLRDVSEPLIIGCAQDANPKNIPTLEKVQTYPGLVKGDTFTIINPDPDLLSNSLFGSKLIPDVGCAAKEYRIFKVVLCTDGYGDVNGDGTIDTADIVRAAELIGESLASPSTQQKIVDGEISTLEMLRADVDGDGYITTTDVTLITEFVTRQVAGFPVGSSFTHMELTVQQSIGRYDGYYSCTDGYVELDGYTGQNIVPFSSLSLDELVYDGYLFTPSIDGYDTAFTTVPFSAVTYQIIPQPFWQDYLVSFSSDARQMPASFTYDESVTVYDCSTPTLFECENKAEIDPGCDPGRNDFFVPDNLIIGNGQILDPDGTNHKIDFEVGQIILELPEVPLTESSIDVFHKLVADVGDGFTSAGYVAMKFSDCSTVKSDALVRNQVRFGVSIQAFVPNLDGYDDDGYGIIVDDIIGVFMDHTNGILTLSLQDLEVDPIYQTLVTKIQITVYLKKGGFNNTPLTVTSDQMVGLISS